MLLTTLFILLVLLALCGISFYILSLYSAWRFEQRALAPDPVRWPAVSILKPLRGADPEMLDSFRSHCDQDYRGEYEVIFGVTRPDDPAAEAVKRLQQEYPRRRIELVLCEQRLGANGKVSALLQLLPRARHEHIVVNDSDIRVEPDYLRAVVRELAQPQAGMVTALYRAHGTKSLGAVLEALGVSTDFIPGVLTARQLEGGLRFAMGSTLAFTRTSLAAAGGLEPLLDHLADDYELGERIAKAGLRVELAETVVETFLPKYTFGGFLKHQLRWGRTLRASRPAGFAGMFLSFGFVWALILFLAAPATWWTLAIFGAAVVLRAAVAVYVGRVLLQDSQVIWQMPLIFVRDIVFVSVWLMSLFGSTIEWRGERFRLRGKRLQAL